jgi:endonuclease/exonuclease/phosphatase family metal-dependent hydrolase
VDVFGVHFDWYYGDGNLSTNWNRFMEWQAGYSGHKIVAGDFNSWFIGTETQQWGINYIRGTYTDTCLEKYGSDEACPHTNFPPTGSWRPDAIYRSSGITTDLSTFNIDDRGTWYSDHKPIYVRFNIPQ